MKTSRKLLITLLVGVIVSIIFAVVAQVTFVVGSINYGLLRLNITDCESEGKKANWDTDSTEIYNEAVDNMNHFIESSATGRFHNFLARFGWFGNFTSVIVTLLAGIGLYSIICIGVNEAKEVYTRKRKRNHSNYRVR